MPRLPPCWLPVEVNTAPTLPINVSDIHRPPVVSQNAAI
jgi:hypothetical protein